VLSIGPVISHTLMAELPELGTLEQRHHTVNECQELP
jgi:hypothetical protein